MAAISEPSAHSITPRSGWYAQAMERLIGVVQALSQARDLQTVTTIVCDAARNLTGADGATFVLRDGDQCHYVDENAISPLWKGRRFSMNACISGWAMFNARSAVIEDIYSDPRIPADVYSSTFVKSLAIVPIRRAEPIGAIGIYWAARHLPTDDQVAVLQALADTTSVALENVHLYKDLHRKIQTLQEQRVYIDEQRDALEVLTRALAHDLKEPVRTMRSFSELIGRSGISADQSSRYLDHIQKAVTRMGMLVDTFFRYTQLDDPAAVTKVPCAMMAAANAVKDHLAELIRERGAVVISDWLPEVHANPAQMTQVLENLVSNAVRHGESPVTVRIHCDERSDDWLFSVTDNGPGIAPEDAEKIFLPFKRLTRNQDGAGLGLSICRKIIAGHGGNIWCESTLDCGATFFFTLPKLTESMATVDQPSIGAASDSAVPALATVLLVDDREDDVEVMRLRVFNGTNVNCNVRVALSGEQALKILREKKAEVDLILLDINMPGMDGFDVLQRVHQDPSLQQLPVVMCTGSDYEEDRRRAEALGAAGYLVKPSSFDQFEAIVKKIATLQLDRKDGSNSLLTCQPHPSRATLH